MMIKKRWLIFFFNFMEIFLTDVPKFREKSCSNGEWRCVGGKQGGEHAQYESFHLKHSLCLVQGMDLPPRLGTSKQPNKSVMTLWMCSGDSIPALVPLCIPELQIWELSQQQEPGSWKLGCYEVLKPEIITS